MLDYQIFAESSSTDRILLYMLKVQELEEVSKLLSKEDVKILMKVLKEEE